MSAPGSRKQRKPPVKSIPAFCRIKPPERKGRDLEYQIVTSLDENNEAKQAIQFTKPISATHGSQQYTFNQIFTENTSQNTIFEQVGKEVIDNALKGYNGTVFAYGQTATGKTYTIMGEELEQDRSEKWGMIPRVLEYVYGNLEASDHKFTVYASFLEVYKENMFDLLDAQELPHDKKMFLHKNKVSCKMDRENVRFEGLTVRKVTDSDEAMDTFFEGYQNREVAETYANDKSSRSHTIFTLYVYAEDETGSVESKLNFVDLAGSERVSKDHLGNTELIAEAKEINRSLLFLHKVIKSIASGRKPETFRNTMITRILRDSLIGNSMTSLIATISIDELNYDETLATCDFAQSVSKIKTKPKKNRKEDLNRTIQLLQEENELLRKQLRQFETQTELGPQEKEDLSKKVIEYYDNDQPGAILKVKENDEVSQFCFTKLKETGKEREGRVKDTPLSDEEKRELEAKLTAFLAQSDSANPIFEIGDNKSEFQFCLARLRQIIQDYDDRPEKSGCCGGGGSKRKKAR